jgi:predicted site-specific integrase-resolvase
MKKMIGARQAAGMLGLSPKTLLAWVRRGRCPLPAYQHPSGTCVFDVSDIEKYLEIIKLNPH